MVINNDRTIMGGGGGWRGSQGVQSGLVTSFICDHEKENILSLVLNLTTFRSIDQQQVENSERGHVYRLRDKVVNAMLSLVIFTMFISGSESVKRRRGARSLTNRF